MFFLTTSIPIPRPEVSVVISLVEKEGLNMSFLIYKCCGDCRACNPTNVGTSFWNLGNHTLAICFIMCIVFVVYASYQ